jgi:hypothetical protein
MFTKKEASTLMLIISLLGLALVYNPLLLDVYALEHTSSPQCLSNSTRTFSTCCWSETSSDETTVTDYCINCSKTKATSRYWTCGHVFTTGTYVFKQQPGTLPPSLAGKLNGNPITNQFNSTNNTTPSRGLLNKIPGASQFNAPITTGGNTSNNPSNNNTSGGSSTAMRFVYSPTGGCIPGGSTCVPCDIGLSRIGANCIPSGDWHPTNGLPPLSTLQQQQQPTPPPSTTTLPPSAGLLNKAPTDHTERCFAIVKGGGPVCKPSGTANTGGPVTTVLCPDGSTPDANGKCPTSPNTTTTTNQQATPTPTTIQHHHKGSNVSGGINKR